MKYKPDVWKLKRVIEKQQRISDSQKEAHYVLGDRTIEGSGDDPRDKPKKKTKKERDVYERLNILEAKITWILREIRLVSGHRFKRKK